MEVISYQNYKTVEQLNELLKEAGIEKRFTLEVLETREEIGIRVGVPPLFNKNKDHYYVTLSEEFALTNMNISEIIVSLNSDLKELLKTIKPDILEMLALAKSKLTSQVNINLNITNL